jgi:TolB protein
MSPAWSADGKILAYVSYRDKNPDLFGLDLGTGKRWKISGAEGLNISPAWSPDGKRLAVALSKDGGTEIYTMTREGRDQERLTFGIADNVAPSWAPNNREIVFNSGRAGSPQLYIMGADGTNVRRVTFEESITHRRTGRRAAPSYPYLRSAGSSRSPRSTPTVPSSAC